MKKYIYLLISVAILISIVVFLSKNIAPEYKISQIVLGGETFNTQVADTPTLKEIGLSYRKSIAQNEAMLFVFQKPGQYKFWMKDMNFPIDIIWLSSDKKIVYVKKNLSPNTYPQVFGPTINSQYVIEVTSDTVDRLDLSLGQTIYF